MQPKQRVAQVIAASGLGHNGRMALTIPVAHDFICPWCWVGFLQAKRLKEEFGAEIDWLGYELFPDELEWPDWKAGDPPPPNKPIVPTRFELMLAAERMTMPGAERPQKMRTHNAHEAIEFAKTEGVADALIEALYRAYWQQGVEINNPAVLRTLAEGIVKDLDGLSEAIATRKFKENIVGFDDPAYALGVYNVPTFFIDGGRYAEQPYTALVAAVPK